MGFAAIPTKEEMTCRGKAGKSRPHLHYMRRPVPITGRWVGRCSSCERILFLRRMGIEGRGNWEIVPDDELPAVAVEVMNAVL